MASRAEKLLVISEIGLGDALTLLPALRALKSLRPDVSIHMLAPSLFPLRDNVRDVVLVLDSRILRIGSAGDQRDWLGGQGYDAVWNTENEHSSWRTILAEGGNPRWISAPPHRSWPHRQVLELRLEQLRSLYPEIGDSGDSRLELTPEQGGARDRFRSLFPPGEILVAMQPGAKDKTKVWPAEKFIALAGALARRPGTTVCFFLAPDDRTTFDRLLPDIPGVHRFTESLEVLLPKLAACRLFIGNDSGFYHLAYALGLEVVGIYRSRRYRKVWSYPTPRSRGVYFYLPSPLRHHWKRCVSVGRVRKAAEGLLIAG
jgi:ADP-heptose:LPS heptosyltransferase